MNPNQTASKSIMLQKCISRLIIRDNLASTRENLSSVFEYNKDTD